MEISRKKLQALMVRRELGTKALANKAGIMDSTVSQILRYESCRTDTVYDDLFSFAVDGKVDGKRKHENFTALYRRVAVVAGLGERRDGNKSFSAVPMQELKCSEYDRFGKLIADICSLIYSYKNEKEEKSDGEIRG